MVKEQSEAGAAQRVRHVVGVMTGTSLDGMDAALVRIEGEGLGMRAALVAHEADALGECAVDLGRFAGGEAMAAGEIAGLALRFGERHVAVIARLLARAGRAAADLIAVHGQTVFHAPPVSWQMVNVAPIAHAFGCAVVHDLRAADLAAGGEGAPITPIADLMLFRDPQKRRAIVNLGGFANVTVLPAVDEGEIGETLNGVRGFDICACNHLMNAVARICLNEALDRDGETASRGVVDEVEADALRGILEAQRDAERSLGSAEGVLEWVSDASGRMEAAAVAATAAEALGGCIAKTINAAGVEEVFLAGGGVHHRPLRRAIAAKGAAPVRTTEALGVSIEAREAVAMAVLGALAQDGVPITLPQVTGAKRAVVAGAWSGGGRGGG